MTNEMTTTSPTPQMILRMTRGKAVKEQPVATLNEASAIWSAYRDQKGLRSSSAPRVDIVVEGEPRAYVSYNGKVYEGRPEGWKSGVKPLFDPYADLPPLYEAAK